MKFPEFKYTRLAIGGPQDNKTVVTLDKVTHRVTPVDIDVFIGMYRFKKEYYDYAKERGSVAGARFECYSDWMWLDLDHPRDITFPALDVRNLLNTINSMVNIHDIEVWFSGNKGFHVGIPSDAVAGLDKPSAEFPILCRKLAHSLKKELHLKTIDTAVYDANRLWRLPFSIHGKSKYTKHLCDMAELLSYISTSEGEK